MANQEVKPTYESLLSMRSNLLRVRDNAVANEQLGKLFESVANGAELSYYQHQLDQIATATGIEVNVLDEYYSWFYESARVDNMYLFIRDIPVPSKPRIDSRADGQALPHGVRVVGLFNDQGCMITGYIPTELESELLCEIQDILMAFHQLDVIASEVNLRGYTEF